MPRNGLNHPDRPPGPVSARSLRVLREAWALRRGAPDRRARRRKADRSPSSPRRLSADNEFCRDHL